MSEKSRNEKIALAKKRLKKFRDQKDVTGLPVSSASESTKSKQRKANPMTEAATAAGPDSDEAVSSTEVPPHRSLHQHLQLPPPEPMPPPPAPPPLPPQSPGLSGNGDSASVCIEIENGASAGSGEAEISPSQHPEHPHNNQHQNHQQEAPSSVSGATESLMQLSQQINGIMSWDSPDQQSQQRAQLQQSLERRNVELASLLESRTESLDQAKRSQAQLREQLQRIQTGAAADLAASEERHRRELQAAREQQAGQAQTIGLLVAEKTELASQLAHSQRLCQQRLSELADAQERLRGSRARLVETEKSLASAESSASQLTAGGRESAKEAERVRVELQRVAAERAEFEQASSELKAKLASKSLATAALEDQVRELRRQLELAAVQLHQLGATRDRESRAAATELQSANTELTERLAQLMGERDRLAEQYREYTGRLGAEAKQLKAQLSALGTERTQLVNRIAELDGQLQAARAEAESAKEATAEAEAAAARLLTAKEEAARGREAESEERQRLLELVEDREAACERLRSEMRSARADQQRLVDSVQSDRSTLSRALQQNRELKSQLEELQSGFVAASNRAAELTQMMQSEQHLAKELAARLGEQEDELRELRQDLAAREDELRALKLAYQSARETLLYREPSESEDAASASSEAQHRLSQELAAAQARVNQLTASNSELKALLYRSQAADDEASATADNGGDGGGRSRNQSNAALQASLDQLESERNALLRTIDELRSPQTASSGGSAVVVAHVTRDEFEEMQRARLQLEERFHSAMNRVAQLQDDKERLEHKLMQLEVETETIGEYVTLYQYQRSQLHQRELEKEASMSQLAAEREQMRLRLSELETLVRHLMPSQQPQQQQQQQQPSISSVPEILQHEQQQPHPQHHNKIDGVHTGYSKTDQQSAAASRILDIISQLHGDSSGDPVRVMQCPCCHGSVIDL